MWFVCQRFLVKCEVFWVCSCFHDVLKSSGSGELVEESVAL